VEYDFLIIGAGAAGEAAAHLAAERGASAVVIERELVGGSCAFWACMPSKSLLHDAGVHVIRPSHSWQTASDRRDWMINREGIDQPDDSSHAARLEKAGVRVVRGEAHIEGPGRVNVATASGATEALTGRNIVVAVGSRSAVPSIEGLDRIRPWTNREATSARELPRSLAILGGGPTGLELAQVYARYGVAVALVHSHERLNQRDHPRSSAALRAALERDGVNIVAPARAVRVIARKDAGEEHEVVLSDGSSIRGAEVLLAIGRSVPLQGLGLDNVGVALENGRLPGKGELRLGDGVWVAGDPAGPEMHTHLAHYQGELVIRMALGDDVRPDYRAIPRAIYTDPEIGGVGMTLEEAHDNGLEATEVTEDLGKTAKGYVADAQGHVTIVVDTAARVLLGAFICGPGASEVIHEAVLAIKMRTPIDALADTLHAFPTTARVLGTLFTRAAREISGRRGGTTAVRALDNANSP
jgi:pyruvate/2-oxoglutarate dehydrogenase complex dihydrolipoamide dehydrogenase (E3) component